MNSSAHNPLAAFPHMVWTILTSHWTRRLLLWATVGAVGWVAWRLEPPLTLLSVSLKTEVLSVSVVRRTAARILLPVAMNTRDKRCYRNVIISPDLHTTVHYARPRGESLIVSITGKATWEAETVPRAGVRSTDYRVSQDASPQFEVSKKNATCALKEVLRVRLPVNGIADFGSPLFPVDGPTSPQLALLSGKMTVYGRAISEIAGMSLNRAPFQPDTLYLSQELTLPGGTRIVTADVDQERATQDAAAGGAGSRASSALPGSSAAAGANVAEIPESTTELTSRWQGYADVSFGSDDPGSMDVEASTTARRVLLYSPAGGRGRAAQEPDIVSLSLGAQLTGDPNLRWLGSMLAVLGTVLTLSALFEGLFKRSNPPSEKAPACPVLPQSSVVTRPVASTRWPRPRSPWAVGWRFRPLQPQRRFSLSTGVRKGRASRSPSAHPATRSPPDM